MTDKAGSKMTGEIAAIISTAVTGIFAVLVALIEARATRERRSTEKRAARRARESRLSMDMMYAATSLAMDTARALRDGHTNGTLGPDLAKAKEAKAAYDSFLRDEAAAAVAKR